MIDAVYFDKDTVEGRILEINLMTDQTFQSDPPNPAIAVTVTNWQNGALSGITVPTPALDQDDDGDWILQFTPSGGTVSTSYQLRFIITTEGGQTPAVHAVVQVGIPAS